MQCRIGRNALLWEFQFPALALEDADCIRYLGAKNCRGVPLDKKHVAPMMLGRCEAESLYQKVLCLVLSVRSGCVFEAQNQQGRVEARPC
jgi:hypothetical protein